MPDHREKLNAIEDLFLKAPLYREFAVDKRDQVVEAILTFGKAVDTYCAGCKQPSTFRGVVTQDTQKLAKTAQLTSVSPGVRYTPWAMRTIAKSLMCTREHHVIEYHFVCEQDDLAPEKRIPC